MGTNASLFDRVSELLRQSGALDRISETIEEDMTTTTRLATEATAVLIAGSARRLSSGAIDGVAYAPLGTVDGGSVARVGWPVTLLLGERWPHYVQGLAEFNGVAVEHAQLVFRRVAPIVVAAVKERQEAGDLNRFQLARILHQERNRVMSLGLLSWAPHSTATPTAPAAASHPPLQSGRQLDASRNVAKHRRPPSEGPIGGGARSRLSEPDQPLWLWWSLVAVLIVLTVAWILSQTL